VVDDNTTNRAVLRGYLAGWGIDVEVADTGRRALDMARAAAAAKAPFAVVVSDMHMPGMNGLELAAALTADPATAGIPTVLLSSSGDDRGLGAAPGGGVTAQLAKPVRRDRLRRCLAEMVGPPAPAGEAEVAAAAPLGAERRHPNRGRVLLAEDNLINRKVAVAMLESGGYTVDLAGDGVEAVRAVHARRYDVVLMDCQMPEMDGYEAAAEIRAGEGAGRRIPIIAMTAGAMQEDRDRALAAGMDDYLAKPVKRADVLAAVGRWAGTAGARTCPASGTEC
jgi:CheY-like chemotaxis protein